MSGDAACLRQSRGEHIELRRLLFPVAVWAAVVVGVVFYVHNAFAFRIVADAANIRVSGRRSTRNIGEGHSNPPFFVCTAYLLAVRASARLAPLLSDSTRVWGIGRGGWLDTRRLVNAVIPTVGGCLAVVEFVSRWSTCRIGRVRNLVPT